MKEPKQFQEKPITLEATAHILYGGVLLKSEECNAPEVTVHYAKDFEKRSNAGALESLQHFERAAHKANLRGADLKAERTIATVVLEGRLEKNPFYHVQMDRGAATLAAWDYQNEYAFVVTRVVSVKPSL
ncbi:MAG TPA: hypothetical protein VLL54_15925 [Pyrinomonadaceae bacterium]|nr:hypothetical protein [Pyrinomonadaceae bacterium]